ncbi:hypothetical protein NDU88_003085 [Pleurodeles waltl]|uniref:Uncharacterized protein n=1 Tax=Pleurodeles waltl TaxID=8319 RepID=A0AAV7W147_PLEWA|nr:hypothetical protein NDU88_003085 [Pleurodeles waltl]
MLPASKCLHVRHTDDYQSASLNASPTPMLGKCKNNRLKGRLPPHYTTHPSIVADQLHDHRSVCFDREVYVRPRLDCTLTEVPIKVMPNHNLVIFLKCPFWRILEMVALTTSMANPGDSDVVPKWAQCVLGLLGNEQSELSKVLHKLVGFANTESGPMANDRLPCSKYPKDMGSFDHIFMAYADSRMCHFGMSKTMANSAMAGTSSTMPLHEEVSTASGEVPIDSKSHTIPK